MHHRFSIGSAKPWIFSAMAAACLGIIAPCSQATPLPGTVLTSPGTTVFPGLVASGTPSGTLLASLVSPYSFSTTAGTTSGTLTSAVYRNTERNTGFLLSGDQQPELRNGDCSRD